MRYRHVTDDERAKRVEAVEELGRVRGSQNGEVRLLRRDLSTFLHVVMTAGERSRQREELALSKKRGSLQSMIVASPFKSYS